MYFIYYYLTYIKCFKVLQYFAEEYFVEKTCCTFIEGPGKFLIQIGAEKKGRAPGLAQGLYTTLKHRKKKYFKIWYLPLS